ncbi:hypothetical protein D3C76_1348040 [compost metagenome]
MALGQTNQTNQERFSQVNFRTGYQGYFVFLRPFSDGGGHVLVDLWLDLIFKVAFGQTFEFNDFGCNAGVKTFLKFSGYRLTNLLGLFVKGGADDCSRFALEVIRKFLSFKKSFDVIGH